MKEKILKTGLYGIATCVGAAIGLLVCKGFDKKFSEEKEEDDDINSEGDLEIHQED